jgi:hypothetical protein
MAMMPLERILAVGPQGGFLHDAAGVANIRNCSPLEKSSTASTLAIFSPVLEFQQVGHRAPLAGAAHLRHVVNPPRVDAALIGEKQQVIVRVGHEQMLDKIAFLGFRPGCRARRGSGCDTSRPAGA